MCYFLPVSHFPPLLLLNIEFCSVLPMDLISCWLFLLVKREGEFSVFPGNVWYWKEAGCCRESKGTARVWKGLEEMVAFIQECPPFGITIVVVDLVTFSLSFVPLGCFSWMSPFPSPICRRLPYWVRRGAQTQTRQVLSPSYWVLAFAKYCCAPFPWVPRVELQSPGSVARCKSETGLYC